MTRLIRDVMPVGLPEWVIPTCTGINCSIMGASAAMYKIRKREMKSESDRRAKADNPGAGAGSTAKQIAGVYASNLTLGPHPFVTNPASGSRLEVVKQADPLRGWKQVMLGVSESDVWIMSAHNGWRVDPSGQKAECLCHSVYGGIQSGLHNPASIPDLGCTCGWYALKSRPGGGIVAEVDLYGTVIDCETGYRAQYQRILGIAIPRDRCRRGFLCDQPTELLYFTTQTLLQVCREHGVGEERTVELSRLAAHLGVEVKWQPAFPQ